MSHEVRPALLERAIEASATNPPGASPVHGEDHWKGVAIMARLLGVDRDFAVTFAVLHDVARTTDGHDPDHGRRAARLFRRLVAEGLGGFAPGAPRTVRMEDALADHADGYRSKSPQVARCWDADRLLLPRVGIEPSDALLSTRAARDEAAKDAGWRLALEDRLPDWSTIERQPASAVYKSVAGCSYGY